MPNQQVDVSNTSSREEPELGIPRATDVVQASPSPEKGAGSHSAEDAPQLDGVASSAAYFAPAVVQPRAGNIGFWRGSPAEIIFATLTAIAVILAVILSVVRIPGPASASTGSNTGAQSGSSSNASKPSITVPAHKTYDAAAPAAPQGSTVNIELVAQESLISIAPGAAYQAWTFNGTVPGPILRVRQGQTVNFTIVNKTGMDHSIDFHAAETPWNINYQAVGAGKSFSFSWKAMYPGIFMYHCGTPPVIQHIANGMYGAIIVDPASGWRPAQEYVLVQSEFYTRKLSDGSLSFDHAKAMAMQPDYVTFNGYANQYKDAPLTAHLGQRVRLFVLNAGPSEFSAFHTIGAMFTDVYMDGNPANHMVGNQTVTIPPGGGAVVELSIPEAGLYPFVTHSFANASAGALGVLEIKK
jgi:nitrite reductase (NO-forming)